MGGRGSFPYPHTRERFKKPLGFSPSNDNSSPFYRKSESKYCNEWGLAVNTNKTKFMVAKSNRQLVSKLTYNNMIIEQVTSFKYLGIEFSYDGDNLITKSDLYKRGLKAYFKLMRSLNPAPTPSVSLHLFDHLLKPILLYGCEIWSPIDLKYKITTRSHLTEKDTFVKKLREKFPYITKYFDKIDLIEKLHLKFCKSTLGVNSKATNLAVYSELGRYPLLVDRITACMKYLHYVETETENKLLKSIYKCLATEQKLKENCKLLNMEKQMSNFIRTRPLASQNAPRFFKQMKQCLMSSFDVYWHQMLNNDISITCKTGGNKLRTYRTFKNRIIYENYLNLKDIEKRKQIARMRISAHKLRIETQRFNNRHIYIPPELRTCINCIDNKTEDEYHFLVECSQYQSLRNELFNKCSNLNKHFNSYGNCEKIIWIMTSENMEQLGNLGTFIVKALNVRRK